MNNAVETRDLTKEFSRFVLDGISLEIPKGQIVGLIGPNGAGKTTVINLLMNMLIPDGGSIEILGMSHRESEKEIKNRVGYVGEQQYYYENKKVAWTGKFVSRFFRDWDGKMFESLLEEFGIDPSKRIRSLSKGMKVKLSIAIALSHSPELLLLDEPTAGLDPVIRREVLDKLMRFRGEEEKSVLISSHITDDIMRIADRVAFIVNGKIVIDREKDDIVSNWKKIHFRKGVLGADIVSTLRNVEEHAFGSSGITGEYQKIRDRLAAAEAAGDCKIENVTLDDVLIAFVRGE